MKKVDILAYLAPEIPSISGTFVYKEILALQNKNIKVIPISIHKTENIVQEQKVKDLASQTIYLYQQSLLEALIKNSYFLLAKPKNYLSTLFIVLSDIISSGITKAKSWKLFYQFLYASIVAKTMIDNSCQHLHIHFAHVPTQIGMYASALTKIPFTFTCHANDIFENKFLLKQKANRAKAVVTISKYNYKYLSNLGITTDKLKVVRCGIDTKNWIFMKKHNNKNPPTIGSLGRLIEKKGMDDLISALGQLHKKGVDFRLEIAGEGILNEKLGELTEKYNISSKTEFKGTIPNDKVCNWLKSLDVFVLACKEDSKGDKDGIPVVLMEAMALGIPVISTDISGVSELIQNKKSGFLAQPNNPESLANVIYEFLHEPFSLDQITQEARNRVTDEFELKTNVEQLIAVFNI